MAFVPLFAPSLSAALVVLSVMFGEDVDCEVGVSCSDKGPVDLGIKMNGMWCGVW